MKEKNLEERIILLEKEVSVMGEEFEKLRLELRQDIDRLLLELEAVKDAFLNAGESFGAALQKARKKAFLEKNPEKL